MVCRRLPTWWTAHAHVGSRVSTRPGCTGRAPLAAVAIAGFLLGSCGGGEGGALTTATGVTVSRPALTATRPATTEEPTPPTRTAEPTVGVTTTERSTTVTLETTVETQTTVSVTIVPATTTTAETTAATTGEEESSGNDTPWGWIALGVALAAALLVAFLSGDDDGPKLRPGPHAWRISHDAPSSRWTTSLHGVRS